MFYTSKSRKYIVNHEDKKCKLSKNLCSFSKISCVFITLITAVIILAIVAAFTYYGFTSGMKIVF